MLSHHLIQRWSIVLGSTLTLISIQDTIPATWLVFASMMPRLLVRNEKATTAWHAANDMCSSAPLSILAIHQLRAEIARLTHQQNEAVKSPQMTPDEVKGYSQRRTTIRTLVQQLAIPPEAFVAHNEEELFNPDTTLDSPISLKELTRQATRELERKIILKVLQANHWNRTKAARRLCISYRSLLYKIKGAGLCPEAGVSE